MFRYYVNECRIVEEDTSYVEILNFSVRGGYCSIWIMLNSLTNLRMYEQDPFYNSCEEHPLTDDEFDNFVFKRVSSKFWIIQDYSFNKEQRDANLDTRARSHNTITYEVELSSSVEYD